MAVDGDTAARRLEMVSEVDRCMGPAVPCRLLCALRTFLLTYSSCSSLVVCYLLFALCALQYLLNLDLGSSPPPTGSAPPPHAGSMYVPKLGGTRARGRANPTMGRRCSMPSASRRTLSIPDYSALFLFRMAPSSSNMRIALGSSSLKPHYTHNTPELNL
jgi:hypothetical protein